MLDLTQSLVVRGRIDGRWFLTKQGTKLRLPRCPYFPSRLYEIGCLEAVEHISLIVEADIKHASLSSPVEAQTMEDLRCHAESNVLKPQYDHNHTVDLLTWDRFA